MGVICLSLAPILRCVSLTRVQYGILLIPPGLEVLFCLALVVSKWKSSDTIYLLIAAEGLTFFFGALLDFLTHIIPAARSSLHLFKTLDIVLGSLTFVPLLLYTIFLFLMAQSELLQTLPVKLQAIVRYILAMFIPLIVMANAVGSFVGISYRSLSTTGRRPVLVVGFLDNAAQLLWTFFNSFALALLTSYQVLSFLLFFSRTMNVLRGRRSLEKSGNDAQNHLFNGVVYMAIGLKVGAIETVVGFAQGNFGQVLARRILRFIGRAFLIIGVIKGWDSLEDFALIASRRPKRNISNPQYSTFHHVNGDPESNIAQRAGLGSYSVLGNMSRVTVQFPRDHAPILCLRLSDLVPISNDLDQESKSIPIQFDEDATHTPSSYTPPHFSNLVPFIGGSMMTATKDLMSKARAPYHRYTASLSSLFGDSDASVNNRVDFYGAKGAHARDSKYMDIQQPPQTIHDGSRSRISSIESGMWLGRPVNRRSSPTAGTPNQYLVPPDQSFPTLATSREGGSQGSPYLTGRWTATTNSVSTPVRSPLSPHGERSVRPLSWAGHRPSRQDSNVPPFEIRGPVEQGTGGTATSSAELNYRYMGRRGQDTAPGQEESTTGRESASVIESESELEFASRSS